MKTARKIRLAKEAYRIIAGLRRLLRRPSHVIAHRGGLRWRLDLSEGIDLSIYLLGGFEKRTLRAYQRLIRRGDTVLDIGANVGAHTLPLALQVGDTGRVVAVEPTAFAIQKLQQNLGLNPVIQGRVTPAQFFLTSAAASGLREKVYSSWPLTAKTSVNTSHGGQLMNTSGAQALTLDEALQRLGISRVDFIKLDVDGAELEVLRGAQETLRMHRPRILLELAPYVYADMPSEFDLLISLLRDYGYLLFWLDDDRELPESVEAIRQMIGADAGTNVLAIPA